MSAPKVTRWLLVAELMRGVAVLAFVCGAFEWSALSDRLVDQWAQVVARAVAALCVTLAAYAYRVEISDE